MFLKWHGQLVYSLLKSFLRSKIKTGVVVIAMTKTLGPKKPT